MVAWLKGLIYMYLHVFRVFRERMVFMYSKIQLFRPPLVLPKSGLISRMVLILNVAPEKVLLTKKY